MMNLFVEFLLDEAGQDFAEYALLLAAIGVVAVVMIPQFRTALFAAFQKGVDALRVAAFQ